MNLLDHIIDTMKEWELKLGQIDTDIRLYYPPGTMKEFLKLDDGITEDELIAKIQEYLKAETSLLGDVQIEMAKDHRIGLVISKEGCRNVAEQIPVPDFLEKLLHILKKQNLDLIKEYFREYAQEHGGTVKEEVEDDGVGTVLYFDRESIDPYVYCFDSDFFGVTYHRFSHSDYEKLK